VRKLSDLKLSGDDVSKARLLQEKQRVKDIGLIRVQVWQVLIGAASRQIKPISLDKTALDFSEKSMKGKSVSHGTS